jgi:hypothetical protein
MQGFLVRDIKGMVDNMGLSFRDLAWVYLWVGFGLVDEKVEAILQDFVDFVYLGFGFYCLFVFLWSEYYLL